MAWKSINIGISLCLLVSIDAALGQVCSNSYNGGFSEANAGIDSSILSGNGSVLYGNCGLETAGISQNAYGPVCNRDEPVGFLWWPLESSNSSIPANTAASYGGHFNAINNGNTYTFNFYNLNNGCPQESGCLMESSGCNYCGGFSYIRNRLELMDQRSRMCELTQKENLRLLKSIAT